MMIDLAKIPPGKAPAVVLGLGQNGLATVRSLARAGIPVIGMDHDLRQFTARTRLCQKIELPAPKDSDALVDVLIKLGKVLPRKGVLFPSGDASLLNVSENRDALSDYYHFSFPAREIVTLTLDKKKFYLFAKAHEIAIPDSYFPESFDDCAEIARSINYPCLIKPYQPHSGWRQRFPGQKLVTAEGPARLESRYRELARVHRDLIIQEIIPGGENQLAFSLTYLDSSSKPLGMFTGRKLRQYPLYYGTSSLAESRFEPEIAANSIRILQAMHYTGYGSVEFKWDPRQSVFKAIEVTARTWFPHGLSAVCGINLVQIAYCDRLGLPLPRDNGFREGVKWIHEDRDLRSGLSRWRKGELTLSEWLGSYRGKRTYALAARDDPAVFLSFLWRLATVPWRKVLGLAGLK